MESLLVGRCSGRSVARSIELGLLRSERSREHSIENVRNSDVGVSLAYGALADQTRRTSPNFTGLHHELELLVEAGWTPLEAIRASTYDAARLMKAENEWGSLQPGRRATLLIVNGNPADHISDTRKIETLIQDGRIVDRSTLKYDAKKDAGYRVVPGLFNP